MSNYLPHDVILQILLRLPTKSLVRFRCVSKSWNSTITNPNFITTHLNRPYKNDFFLFRDHLLLHYDGGGTFDRHSWKLSFPSDIKGGFFWVIGSCNGLLCLVNSSLICSKVILWNPSIRKYVTLPAPWPLACKTRFGSYDAVGFGFDSRTHDYKVVRIEYLSIRERKLEASVNVQVYSLATNSWKSIPAVVPHYETFEATDSELSQAFINGNIHWFANYVSNIIHINGYRHNFILSFDMSDEVFREIMIPKSLVVIDDWHISLSILGESLCLLQRSEDYTNYHVWVMRDYGVAESWTKQLTIDQNIGISRVLCFRKCGDLLVQLYSTKELVLYNLESKEIKYSGLREVSGRNMYLDSFMESLVLISPS